MSTTLVGMLIGGLITSVIVGAIYNLEVVFWVGVGGFATLFGLVFIGAALEYRENKKLR